METTTATYFAVGGAEKVHLPLYDSDTGIQVGDDPVKVKEGVGCYRVYVNDKAGTEWDLLRVQIEWNADIPAKDDQSPQEAEALARRIAEMVNTECVRNKWQFDTADVTVETFERAADAATGVIEWKKLTN